MSIKFKARVLLELGAELISSDAVALYELIKNGIDARSKLVNVDIEIVIQPSSLRRLAERWSSNSRAWALLDFCQDVSEHLEPTATQDAKNEFMDSLGSPVNAQDALQRLHASAFEHNSITVRDTGRGMNAMALIDCYLTVGTPGRMHEKRELLARVDQAARDETVPLGEKGIGRLAAMRIGHHVMVYTGVKNEAHWHGLCLDWRPVFEQPDLDANELKFEPTQEAKKFLSEHGTDIIIRDLQTDWTFEKLQALWNTDLAKLADPFGNEYASRFLKLSFQGSSQKPGQPFDPALLAHADAFCRITYRTNSATETGIGPSMQVHVEYRRFSAAVTTSYTGAHLHRAVSSQLRKKGRAKASDRLPGSDEVIAALPVLGDFDAEFYWFNRGRVMRQDPALWSRLQPFVTAWSGGLLVYRDGYRVYPYGSGTDDWLDLDRKALASSAFKLNRAQIVGRLVVTSRNNPKLKDQTNREGFRDCPEKEALRRLLRQAIIGDCRSFLEKVEKEEKSLDPTTVSALDRKIAASSSAATRTLLSIQKRAPQERDAVQQVLAELSEVEDAWKRAKDALVEKGNQLKQYVHLAGVGLSVEFIAHELARSTEHALELLKDSKVQSDPAKLESLRAQLKTINKRVRVIDEFSIPGRQIKTMQDLAELAEIIKDVYDPKASRHSIDVQVRVQGKASKIKVERGQIIQILDNLMSNAMYWLEHRINREVSPSITITVDQSAHSIFFSDNGPGIPVSIAARVFDAFYTTKPAGEGRGLGLSIARQLAKENDADITLLAPINGLHHGFALTFRG